MQVGKGEFGTVHLAKWLGATVAVKVLKGCDSVALGDFRCALAAWLCSCLLCSSAFLMLVSTTPLPPRTHTHARTHARMHARIRPSSLKVTARYGGPALAAESHYKMCRCQSWCIGPLTHGLCMPVTQAAGRRTECHVLQKIHHPHAVQFLGACTREKPYMIVTEVRSSPACVLSDVLYPLIRRAQLGSEHSLAPSMLIKLCARLTWLACTSIQDFPGPQICC